MASLSVLRMKVATKFVTHHTQFCGKSSMTAGTVEVGGARLRGRASRKRGKTAART